MVSSDWLMNKEVEMKWKKAVMVQCKVFVSRDYGELLSQNRVLGWNLNLGHREYGAGVLTFSLAICHYWSDNKVLYCTVLFSNIVRRALFLHILEFLFFRGNENLSSRRSFECVNNISWTLLLCRKFGLGWCNFNTQRQNVFLAVWSTKQKWFVIKVCTLLCRWNMTWQFTCIWGNNVWMLMISYTWNIASAILRHLRTFQI